MRTTNSSRRLPAAALLLLLAACGSEPSETQLIESARKHLDKGQPAAAVIEAKRALDRRPGSAQARLLLGKALLAQGDAAGALVELQRAREGDVPAEQVALELARAHLMAGQVRQAISVLETAALTDAEARAEAKTLLATALLAQGNPERARELLDEALTLRPGYAPAMIVRARLDVAAGRFDEALQQVDELWARDPSQEAAGLLRAALLLNARKNPEGAVEAYRQVIAAHPRSVAARDGAAQVLLRLGKVDEVKAELAELQKFAPHRPETLMLQAQLAYGAKDYRGVRETTTSLLSAAPNYLPALMLAAATEMQTGQWAAAQSLLARLIQVNPRHVPARRMMAETLLQLGQADKAAEVLQPVVDDPAADAESLTLAGSAFLRAGQVKQAEAAFLRATKARPDDAVARTGMAMAQIARGESAPALANLESIARGDAATPADLTLVAARMAQSDLKGALAAIDRLQRKLPAQALPDVLRGRLLLMHGDQAGAGAAFEQALKKEPGAFGAVAGLAALDMKAGRADTARQRFEAFARAHTTDGRPLLALVQLERQVGAPDAAVLAALRRAVKADPGLVAARVELVSALLAQGDTLAALEAAREANAALPEQAPVLDVLGIAQLGAGDTQLALSTFKRLEAMQPKQVLPLLRLADAHMAAKDTRGAAAALGKARELDADNPAVMRGLALVALADRRPQDALALARQVQAKRPREAVGFVIEAEIAASSKNLPQAAAAYRAALQREPSGHLAQRLHRTLVAANDQVGAERVAADWMREHPTDTTFRYHLGMVAVERSDWPGAEAQFRAVLELQPRHAPALNNVAWLMVKQGKPGATVLAERANALTPDRAAVLDTLALALEADGQLAKAVEVQKRATVLEPRNGDYRLRLAQLQIKNGDKSAAREVLKALQGLKGFERQGEVSELLRKL